MPFQELQGTKVSFVVNGFRVNYTLCNNIFEIEFRTQIINGIMK